MSHVFPGLASRTRPRGPAIAACLVFLALCVAFAARAPAGSAEEGAGGSLSPAAADPLLEQIEAERRLNPGGNHPVGALDAYLLGSAALTDGEPERARSLWERSARLDLNFLPARIDLIGVSIQGRFGETLQSLRDCVEILQRDFPTQRWLAANLILGVCLALTLAAVMIAIGLLIRHGRALHHAVMESLSYALRTNGMSGVLAIVVLAMPLLANLGILVTVLFLLFLASYRFRHGERVLALSAGAWGLLVGPMLLMSSPWWSYSPDGRDANLIARAQQAPTSPSVHRRVVEWNSAERASGVALYLEGLARKVEGDGDEAAALYRRAAGGETPPWVLETNLGNALLQAGRKGEALRHYGRAIELKASAFEPHYNLALTHAAQGRFLSADAQFDQASRLNLGRLRALSRTGDRFDPSVPVDALWSASDLWTWTLKNPAPPVPPLPLAALLPLRSAQWTAPIVALAIFLGVSAGRWLRRLIHVHVCYQCGRPVCRRCLVRLERRAYCGACAEALGGMTSREASRLLLRRLLEERPAWTIQLTRQIVYLLPGIGAVLYGNLTLAVPAATAAAAGIALLFFPLWGQPLIPYLGIDPLAGLPAACGWGLIALSFVITLAGIRSARRRSSSIRAFLDRDVDRLAA